MLTSVDAVRAMPRLVNTVLIPDAWLEGLVGAADAAVKNYCKRDLELTAYVEPYDGDTTRDIILLQWPVLLGKTTIAVGSNGAVLPQSTINVVSTRGFHPGTFGDSDKTPPQITLQTGVNSFTTVSYTGTTATSFTGCTGGAGTLTTGNAVHSPCVWVNPQAFGGQSFTNPFGDGNLFFMGSQFILEVDRSSRQGQQSECGLIRRIGGYSTGFIGQFPEIYYSGRLGGSRLPGWPRGDLNIQVAYSAGYYPVPADLQQATTQLVAQLVRFSQVGANLSSENFGTFSYSLLVNGENPELGEIRRTLARYREVSI